jgi:flagellar biosynthetic protein FliQ
MLMTPETVVDIGQAAVRTALFVAGPMLAAGMLVGLVISIFQAATQINEMTMTFVPKIVTVFIVLVLSLPWILKQLTGFTTELFNRLAGM